MPRRTFHRGSGIYSYMGEGGVWSSKKRLGESEAPLAVLGLSPLYPDCGFSQLPPGAPSPLLGEGTHPPARPPPQGAGVPGGAMALRGDCKLEGPQQM